MKRNQKALFTGLVIAVFFICRLSAEDSSNLPTLAVAPFTGNKSQVPKWQSTMGQGFSEMLVESLEGSGNKFQVVEAAETTDLQTEPKPDESNSAAGGKKKSDAGNSAGSRKPAATGASSANSDTNDSASSGKSDASGGAGSDFTFYGEVTQFAVQTNNSQVGDFNSSSRFANVGGKVITARVQIAWRISDTETKKIIKRGTATGSESGSEFNTSAFANAAETSIGGKSRSKNSAANNFFSGLNKAFGNAPAEATSSESAPGGGATTSKTKTAQTPKKSSSAPTTGGDAVAANDSETVGYDDPEFMGSALGKATAKAITNLVEQLATTSLPQPGRIAKAQATADALKNAPGKVLAAMDNNTIIVSLGSKEGFKAGDKLNLYETNDVKDAKGDVVFTDEKLVGEITLDSVQDDKSRASYAGSTPVKEGWTVKAK